MPEILLAEIAEDAEPRLPATRRYLRRQGTVTAVLTVAVVMAAAAVMTTPQHHPCPQLPSNQHHRLLGHVLQHGRLLDVKLLQLRRAMQRASAAASKHLVQHSLRFRCCCCCCRRR